MSDKPHVDLDDPDSIFHTDTEYSTGSYSCSDDKCDQSDCGGLHTYSNSSASETSNYEGLDVGSDDGGVEQPEKITTRSPLMLLITLILIRLHWVERMFNLIHPLKEEMTAAIKAATLFLLVGGSG